MEIPETFSHPLETEIEKEFEINDFQNLDTNRELEKEIVYLKNVLKDVKQQLEILENRSDRTTGYTMHLLQKLMTIVERNEQESKNPFNFIKGMFKTVKNSCVWAINQLANPQDSYVDDKTFREIINSNFSEEECCEEDGI